MTAQPARPLLQQGQVSKTTTPLRAATYARHYLAPPQLTDGAGTKTWLTRGANFVVAVSQVAAGSLLARENHPDEYMVLLPPNVAATIEAGGERIEAAADSLTIVPPGASSVKAKGAGHIARVFSKRAADLLAQSTNAGIYADGAPEVAPLEPWPDPVGGFKLRHYVLAKYSDPKLFGRLFRSTNLMINPFEPMTAPRNPHALSPHSHDDFEQCSLSLQGTYIHHMRYPWTPDMDAWRDDDHAEFRSPSVLIIPARVIHTTQYIGQGVGWFVDIFGPPRMDFSVMKGLVRNADEYPMPAKA